MRRRFNRPSRNTPFSETLGATGLFRIMRLTESERQAIREVVSELTGGGAPSSSGRESTSSPQAATSTCWSRAPSLNRLPVHESARLHEATL